MSLLVSLSLAAFAGAAPLEDAVPAERAAEVDPIEDGDAGRRDPGGPLEDELIEAALIRPGLIEPAPIEAGPGQERAPTPADQEIAGPDPIAGAPSPATPAPADEPTTGPPAPEGTWVIGWDDGKHEATADGFGPSVGVGFGLGLIAPVVGPLGAVVAYQELPPSPREGDWSRAGQAYRDGYVAGYEARASRLRAGGAVLGGTLGTALSLLIISAVTG